MFTSTVWKYNRGRYVAGERRQDRCIKWMGEKWGRHGRSRQSVHRKRSKVRKNRTKILV